MKPAFSSNLFGRVLFGIIYLFSAIFLICFWREPIFDLNVSPNSWPIYYRLIWCVAFSFLGFSVLVLGWIVPRVLNNEQADENPWPTYPTYYLSILLATSALTFGVLSLYAQALGTAFYALSASLSFLIGFFVDSIPGFLNSLIGRVSK